MYTLEQGALVFLTFLIKDSQAIVFVISIFAIVVLTTFSIHKLVMESRIKMLESMLSKLIEDKHILEFKLNDVYTRYDGLYHLLVENRKSKTKGIYRTKSKTLNKGAP